MKNLLQISVLMALYLTSNQVWSGRIDFCVVTDAPSGSVLPKICRDCGGDLGFGSIGKKALKDKCTFESGGFNGTTLEGTCDTYKESDCKNASKGTPFIFMKPLNK